MIAFQKGDIVYARKNLSYMLEKSSQYFLANKGDCLAIIMIEEYPFNTEWPLQVENLSRKGIFRVKIEEVIGKFDLEYPHES
jgi:hypothetical protein